MLGHSGVGKTFLARCILGELGCNAWGDLISIREWISGGELLRAGAKFRSFPKVADRLKGGEYDLIESLEQPFLLILDDVGAEYDPNKFTASNLNRLIRSRRGKWTVITSNLSVAAIAEKIDQRIASFLIRDGNKAVEIETKDYSLRK